MAPTDRTTSGGASGPAPYVARPPSLAESTTATLKVDQQTIYQSVSRAVALSTLLSLFVSAVGYVVLGAVIRAFLASSLNKTHNLAISLHLICYSFMIVLCIVGCVGISKRKRKIQSFFCAALIAQIIFAIGSGAFCLSILFNKPKNAEEVEACLTTIHRNTVGMNFCHRTPLAKFATVASYLFIWAQSMTTFYMVNRFMMETNEMVDKVDEAEARMDQYRY